MKNSWIVPIDDGFIEQGIITIAPPEVPFQTVVHINVNDQETMRDILTLVECFEYRFEYDAGGTDYPFQIVPNQTPAPVIYHSSYPEDVLFYLIEIAQRVGNALPPVIENQKRRDVVEEAALLSFNAKISK